MHNAAYREESFQHPQHGPMPVVNGPRGFQSFQTSGLVARLNAQHDELARLRNNNYIGLIQGIRNYAGGLDGDEDVRVVAATIAGMIDMGSGVEVCDVMTHNPVHQVYFRAGLLACREYMARFVEHESPSIAASIRANWWPALGDDPGPPRRLAYQEVADERPDGYIDHKEMSASVEALPYADQFLQNDPTTPRPRGSEET